MKGKSEDLGVSYAVGVSVSPDVVVRYLVHVCVATLTLGGNTAGEKSVHVLYLLLA